MKYKVKMFSDSTFHIFESIEAEINNWLSTKNIEIINITCNNYYVIVLYKEMDV